MNWTSVAGLWLVIFWLLWFAYMDWLDEKAPAHAGSNPTAYQGSCPDPSKAQVLRMDGANQITQVLDRNVSCVVVMQ